MICCNKGTHGIYKISSESIIHVNYLQGTYSDTNPYFIDLHTYTSNDNIETVRLYFILNNLQSGFKLSKNKTCLTWE